MYNISLDDIFVFHTEREGIIYNRMFMEDVNRVHIISTDNTCHCIVCYFDTQYQRQLCVVDIFFSFV